MRFGKLTSEELEKNVIDKLDRIRPEVEAGAAIGEDCALLNIPDRILVSSDPITAGTDLYETGALCVSVCCNDVAANGGEPVAMTLTVIMTPESEPSDVGRIMDGATARAKSLGVEIVGGHTEFSDCVTRPIVCGTAIGRTKRPIMKDDFRAGDKIMVTKLLALEGSCLMADEKKPKLTEEERAELASFREMLDVGAESKAISHLTEVKAMHDVTEGGVLGAVAEICSNAGLGARLYEDRMPISKLTEKLCALCGADPLGLVSSGSMLIVTNDPEKVAAALNEARIPVTVIGEVTDKGNVLVRRSGEEATFDVKRDEMYRIYGVEE